MTRESVLIPWDSGAGTVGDAEGFVAQDDTFRQIVIAFRGSDSIRNGLADGVANAGPLISPSSGFTCGTGCLVDPGLFQAYLEPRVAILNAVRVQKLRNPTYTLVVTGHSFGGVLANYAAVDLRNIYGSVDLVCDLSNSVPCFNSV